jgi:hypothetical protein
VVFGRVVGVHIADEAQDAFKGPQPGAA